MGTDEMTGPPTHRSELLPEQDVHVRLGSRDLGVGKVDARTKDGEIVWISFGGATPRRLLLEEDEADFTLLPGSLN